MTHVVNQSGANSKQVRVWCCSQSLPTGSTTMVNVYGLHHAQCNLTETLSNSRVFIFRAYSLSTSLTFSRNTLPSVIAPVVNFMYMVSPLLMTLPILAPSPHNSNSISLELSGPGQENSIQIKNNMHSLLPSLDMSYSMLYGTVHYHILPINAYREWIQK